ncbi:bifunctional UDP-N-acetylglucosamine diphosphorylase/glucosamine-1-phosphate N-acetyltransferase GlmU [Roseomonas sp. GC11]|uniref:bifunctional UDP-N-acetylglucosamine diphosphorylase/glucosamine-1-phosphate N-acetyltransferase GlmU n=1 Tax=Roseomonas sp. GC11 TaxID=2950546 RepID=UPI00210C12F2|nr:bifunctional UDP-N-acetylglucosamine diphosphorylase/glucosamine-1-phosphate N-acetyltransferase GlmU [Roseomonas sp. GC11]MCQ4159307.1 bifunctional UDP-N-acetylglucosamine diphosphorylase/glucosamine-1-phosphate N-acetyltransferase GlmU [Roseomonas sp. GC11]
MSAAAILLAAGLGTRMKSRLPKALHPLAGRPMLNHLIAACEGVFDRLVVVVGPDMPALEQAAAPHATVVQAERLGTGHAALQAAPLLADFPGDVAVLYADNPLITPETLKRLRAARAGVGAGAGLALLAMRPADPAKYGRVMQDAAGDVTRIVEWADASEAERAVGLCNAGVLCAPAADLFRWLRGVRNDNRAGEYYLPDVVPLAVAEGHRVRAVEAAEAELRGINSRAELAEAEAEIQARLRRAALDNGATLIQPASVTFSHDTRLGQDVVVGPNVVFGPGVVVEDGVEIRAFSHLEGCVVRQGAIIGPFARLRPGTEVGRGAHVGNFVELKNAVMGEGAKANHLTYLGDASIGAGSNIGAGTITCNYDGFGKFRTEIGAGVFVGSHTTLVAPIRLGDGSMTAAGSVLTKSVAPDALAFARARAQEKPQGAAVFRASRRKEKK